MGKSEDSKTLRLLHMENSAMLGLQDLETNRHGQVEWKIRKRSRSEDLCSKVPHLNRQDVPV